MQHINARTAPNIVFTLISTLKEKNLVSNHLNTEQDHANVSAVSYRTNRENP